MFQFFLLGNDVVEKLTLEFIYKRGIYCCWCIYFFFYCGMSITVQQEIQCLAQGTGDSGCDLLPLQYRIAP